MKKIIFGIFAITILICGAGQIYAQCACVKDYASAYDEFKDSDAVFVAEVIETKKIRDFNTTYSEFEVKFKVETAWKTDLNETITISNTAASESSEFKKSESYLVFAKTLTNALRANIGCCTNTKLLAKAAKDLQEFRNKEEKPTNVIKGAPKDKDKLNNSKESSKPQMTYTAGLLLSSSEESLEALHILCTVNLKNGYRARSMTSARRGFIRMSV